MIPVPVAPIGDIPKKTSDWSRSYHILTIVACIMRCVGSTLILVRGCPPQGGGGPIEVAT